MELSLIAITLFISNEFSEITLAQGSDTATLCNSRLSVYIEVCYDVMSGLRSGKSSVIRNLHRILRAINVETSMRAWILIQRYVATSLYLRGDIFVVFSPHI